MTAAEQDTVRELVRQGPHQWRSVHRSFGLKQLTKMVVEAALEEEVREHLG